MVGQLASSVQTLAMTVEKGKFPSQPVPNPKGVHEASTSSPQQHGEVKAVMTFPSQPVPNPTPSDVVTTVVPPQPGNERHKYKCQNCGRVGHSKRTCKLANPILSKVSATVCLKV